VIREIYIGLSLTAYNKTWPSSIVLNDMDVSLCCTEEELIK